MKIKLTKNQLKKMIRNEPIERLMEGNWFDGDCYGDTIALFSKRKGGCECMVGGIMRQTLLPRQRAACISDASFAAVGGNSSIDAISLQMHGKTIRDIRSAARRILRKVNPMASLVPCLSGSFPRPRDSA